MFVGPSPRFTPVLEINNWVASHHDTYPLISPQNFNLSGRSVFIAGASKGIGRMTAVRFATAGCSKIAIGARSSLADVEKEIKAAAKESGHPEPTVLVLPFDATSEDSIKAAANAVAGAFGGSLDVLIYNAGYNAPWVPITEGDTADWWMTIDVTLKGLYLCTKHFVPLLLQSEQKLLIDVSSIGALALTPGASAYQVSKTAASRFVEFVDQEYHTEGLVAISLHPGAIKTELGLTMPPAYHGYLIDEPELPADSMVWLANERREWLAGRFIQCNWDVGELEAKKDEIVEKNLLKFTVRGF